MIDYIPHESMSLFIHALISISKQATGVPMLTTAPNISDCL